MEIRNNYSTISYKGLTQQLSRDIYNKSSINTLDRLNRNTHGIVGNLPHQWVKNMPVENREANIKDLYEALGDFVYNRNMCYRDTSKGDKLLTDILREHKAIEEDASVSIRRIGSGYFGQGYEIHNTKDNSSIFLKHFFETNPTKEKTYPTHGASSEINANIYLKHHLTSAEKKCFPRFYYGDLRNNYYISEYINPENSVPYTSIEFKDRMNLIKKIRRIFHKRKLTHSDVNDRNIVYYYDKNKNLKGCCFDLGGVEKIDEEIVQDFLKE